MQKELSTSRMASVDCFKGILIILMVIGHSTGKFNGVIYQFHMAAFFFISGYVNKVDKRNLVTTFFNKFYTLIFPLISSIILISCLLKIINLSGCYNILFQEPYCGIASSLSAYFSNGNTCSLLGATWFLGCLFGICILNKIIWLLCGANKTFYICIITLLYGLGYSMSSAGGKRYLFLNIDLILIGLFFFALGSLCQNSLNQITVKLKSQQLIVLLLFFAAVCWLCRRFGIAVDYPSRNFGNPFLDTLAAVNGIAMCFLISTICSKTRKVTCLLSFLGKNTLPILLFHFSFFKLLYCVLARFNLLSIEELVALTPPSSIQYLWLVFVIFSISGSILIWKVLMCVPPIRVLFGQSKTLGKKLSSTIRQHIPFKINVAFYSYYCAFMKAITTLIWNKVLQLKNFICLHPYRSAFLLVTVACLLFPYLQEGIMCNDELQAHFWSQHGFLEFYKHYWVDHIAKGRAFSTPIVSFTMYLGFIGNSTWVYRLLPVCSIVIDALLFGIFINKILKDRYFAAFCSIVAIICLPITFEHTAPNAFNTLYNIPFAILLLALYLWCDYLESGHHSRLITSMGLYFFVCISYEAFVTYIPLFMLIALAKSKRDNKIKRIFNFNTLIPIGIGILFIVTYILGRIIFPSNYAGNQISGFNLKSSLTIIFQLFKSSIPGYWLFSNRYRYLFAIYNDMSGLDVLRLGILLLAMIVLLFTIRTRISAPESMKSSLAVKILTFACGLLYMILPIIPIALADMYQGNVNENSFSALPSSYFLYYAAVLCLCMLIWPILKWSAKRFCVYIFVIILPIGFALCIQTMNTVFATVSHESADRIAQIEALFSTDFLKSLKNTTIYSEDIYESRNTLAVHDLYWQQYAYFKGSTLEVEGTLSDTLSFNEYNLYYMNDNYFTLCNDKYIIAVSPDRLSTEMPLYCGNDQWISLKSDEYVIDNDFYIYCTEKDSSSSPCSLTAVIEYTNGITIEPENIIYGYYDDGWLEQTSEFIFSRHNLGEINLKLYLPETQTKANSVTVYANDTLLGTWDVTSGITEIHCLYQENSSLCLKMQFAYNFSASEEDSRMVSAILSGLYLQ